MPVGIEIFNTNGTIQISSNTPNWCFIQKIILNNNFANHELTIYGNSPLVFINTQSNILIYPSYKDGTMHKFKIFRALYNSNNLSAILYVFDRLSNPSHNVGFEIYGSDGSSCYSGDNKPLKLNYIFNIPELGSDEFQHSHNFSVSSGNWAAMCATPRYETRYILDNINNAEYVLGDCLNISNTNININCMALYEAYTNSYYQPYGGQLLVADVTGL